VTIAVGIHRLRHNAHVSDAGLLDGIHDGGKCAKRYVFVGAQINRLMPRIANLLLQARSDLVDVDGSLPRKTFCDLSMLMTSRSSVISFYRTVWAR